MIPYLNHEPSEAVNGIFMAVVGSAFALRARQRRGGDDE
jgi:hypothetical protein